MESPRGFVVGAGGSYRRVEGAQLVQHPLAADACAPLTLAARRHPAEVLPFGAAAAAVTAAAAAAAAARPQHQSSGNVTLKRCGVPEDQHYE